jgi:hypothetical protein
MSWEATVTDSLTPVNQEYDPGKSPTQSDTRQTIDGLSREFPSRWIELKNHSTVCSGPFQFHRSSSVAYRSSFVSRTVKKCRVVMSASHPSREIWTQSRQLLRAVGERDQGRDS